MPHATIRFAEAEGHLPDVCLRCGGRAVCRVEKTIRTYDTSSRFGILAPLMLVIDFLHYFSSPTVVLRGPFCERHRHHWMFRSVLIWGIVAAIPVILFGIVALYLLGLIGSGTGPFLGFVTLFVGILSAAVIYGTSTIKLRCDEDAETLVLAHVHAKFIQALEKQREERTTRRSKDAPSDADVQVTAASPKALPPDRDEPFAGLDDAPEERRRRRRGPSTPNYLGLILTAVIGVPIILLVMLAVIFKFSRLAEAALNRPRAEPAAERRDEDPPEADRNVEPGTVPRAPALPPLPAALAERPSIDLIPLADLQKDVGHGKWHVSKGALHCNDGGFVPRIQFPYRPPEEYDFIVTFWQPNLGNGISLVMPNPNGGSFFWFLGNHHGEGYGFHARPNDKEGRKNGLIRERTTHTTVVQVRKDSVRALVDGKEMMRLNTDYRDLNCDDWRRIPNTDFLALACDDATVFYYVRVVEVTGKGKAGR